MTHQGEPDDEIRALHAHRGDNDEWSDEPEPIEVRPSRTTVVSCRLPLAEFERLELAARAAGQSLSEYVRTAIELRRTGGTGATAVVVTSDTPYVQVSIGLSQHSSAPRSSAPVDYPRELQPV